MDNLVQDTLEHMELEQVAQAQVQDLDQLQGITVVVEEETRND